MEIEDPSSWLLHSRRRVLILLKFSCLLPSIKLFCFTQLACWLSFPPVVRYVTCLSLGHKLYVLAVNVYEKFGL